MRTAILLAAVTACLPPPPATQPPSHPPVHSVRCLGNQLYLSLRSVSQSIKLGSPVLIRETGYSPRRQIIHYTSERKKSSKQDIHHSAKPLTHPPTTILKPDNHPAVQPAIHPAIQSAIHPAIQPSIQPASHPTSHPASRLPREPSSWDQTSTLTWRKGVQRTSVN